jgi:hypothetical protein
VWWRRKDTQIHELEGQVKNLQNTIEIDRAGFKTAQEEKTHLLEVLRIKDETMVRERKIGAVLAQESEALRTKVEYYEGSRMNPLYANVPAEMIDQVDWAAMGMRPPNKT